MTDRLLRGLAAGGGPRVVAATSGVALAEAVRRHGVPDGQRQPLGRGLTSALMLSTLTKGDERVTLQLLHQGGGVIVAEANDSGHVRGYARRWRRDSEGVVRVIRDLGLKENFVGEVPLVSGEIDEDVEHYLQSSEQVPSVLRCEVLPSGQAGGILVQSLPGEGAGAIDAMRDLLTRSRLTVALRTADGPEALVRALIEDVEILDVRPVTFRCPCTRERVLSALALLSPGDLSEMVAEGRAEVTCNFCGERYHVIPMELSRLLLESQNRS